ncbi:MAG: leucine-rich repeat domain-containing protein, partial [Firmicutes bacterium]|nr:leucine-rich repeat domain-containing protein [Bacillota bacterium]
GRPVLEIAADGFANCDRLEKVVFSGNNLRVINNMAFASCVNLQSFEIPAGVTALGSYVFNGCDSLKSVSISATVTSIGQSIFRECPLLETLTVDENNRVYKSENNCLLERAPDDLSGSDE